MENRNSREPAEGSFRCRALSIAGFLLALASIGCGAPGQPVPPAPQIPRAVTDLAGTQAGEGAQLSFTLPSKTIRGEPLSETPAVEVLRGAVKPDGSPDAKSFRMAQTIPGSLIENYRAEDRIQISDIVPPDEMHTYSGRVLAYRVRTRGSRRHASADSNTVIVRLAPVAERITTLRATPTETAIELTWTPPARNSEGEPLQAISEYRICKGEIDPASAEAASKNMAQAKWKSPLALAGHSATPAYRDTDFEFGKTYVYTVRTATSADGNSVESSDSGPAIVTPQDLYPPRAPENVVAAVIVADPSEPEVDLSWSINTETDLAGYHVYRSEQQETRGELVTPDLLLSPAYRDTSVQAGHQYWYRVSAVDRAGNESAASAPVAADVTQPSS